MKKWMGMTRVEALRGRSIAKVFDSKEKWRYILKINWEEDRSIHEK